MMDTFVEAFKQGLPITGAALTDLAGLLQKLITGGQDIRIDRFGANVRISGVTKAVPDQTDPVWIPFGTNGGSFGNFPRRSQSIMSLYRRINAHEKATSAIATDEAFHRKWGNGGSAIGQFNAPIGITALFDVGEVEVVVADTGNSRLQVFSSDGGKANEFVYTSPPGAGTAVTEDVYRQSKFSILITEPGNDGWGVHAIRSIFATIQEPLLAFFFGIDRGSGAGDAEYNTPKGICEELGVRGVFEEFEEDNVYVVDSGNDRVQKFDGPAGPFLLKWGTPGAGNGQFNGPTGIISSGTEIYVVDTGNNRIQVFDLLGNFVRKFGTPGSGDGQFSAPRAISLDFVNEEVFVADTGNNRIQVFQKDGTFLRKLGTAGAGDGQLSSPGGVAFYNGEVYVSDTGNNRIQVFRRGNLVPTQTEWFVYTEFAPFGAVNTSVARESLGAPDGGNDTPALDGLIDTTTVLSRFQIVDARDAIEALTEFYVNAETGNPFNWTPFSEDNLYNVVFKNGYDWHRTPDEMLGTDTFDIDFNEVSKTELKLRGSSLI